MTLHRQLYAALSALFLLLLLGMQALYLSNARHYLEQQLASHAQETATSLAISLAARGSLADRALAEAAISPAFDRGYFRAIRVASVTGETVAARELPPGYGGVPRWFTALFPLDVPGSEAMISAGWHQLGRVTVASQPHFVYQQLWHTALETFAYLAAAYALTLAGMHLFLRGILRPLRAIEDVADAIGRRDFRTISTMPRAPELARVVKAINSLSGKVRQAIEEEAARADRLRRQALEDSLTGLYTRGAFEQEYENVAAGLDAYSSTLVLVDVDHVKDVNDTSGRARGDEIITTVAAALRTACARRTAVIGRLAGTHFGVVAFDGDAAAAATLVSDIAAGVSRALRAEFDDERIGFRCGAAHTEDGTPALSKLLASADLALARARCRESGAHELEIITGATVQAPQGSDAWRCAIQKALAMDRYALYAQPAYALPDGELLHTEVLVREIEQSGEFVPASAFIPMMARHGLLPRLDLAMMEKLLAQLAHGAAGTGPVAFNIAGQTVADAHAVGHLVDLLRTHPALARRLVFEMSEFGAASNAAAAAEFAARVRSLGCGYALDHFALHRDGIALLPQLLPDYIKLAGEITRSIAVQPETRFLVESLARIARPLEIRLIAPSVEDPALLAELEALGVEGYQGYASGRPAPLA